MKRQLQGIALILVGIQLTLVWQMDPYILSRDVSPLVNLFPAAAVSIAGLILCVWRKNGR
jgi:hypothetical protein